MRFYRFLAVAGVGILTLAGCGSSVTDDATEAGARASYADGQEATVVSVESANTVTVDIDGSQKQVRLLNVVAPSENNNEPSGSCLINESKEYLTKKLPAGSRITLGFDDAQVGTSGYLDAAIYLGDNLINTDVVGAGMATATYSRASDEFYGEVSQAQQNAATQGVGLYSTDIDCTIPYQIKQATEQARSAADITDEDKRKSAYQAASKVYNGLIQQSKNPADWAGSIVTLTAVQNQLSNLKSTLGDNYYDDKGMTAADHASASATATGRPGGQ